MRLPRSESKMIPTGGLPSFWELHEPSLREVLTPNRLSLQFHDQGFHRRIVQILFGVLGWSAPTGISGLVL